MRDEYENDAHIDELFYLVAFIGHRVYTLSQVGTKQVSLLVMKHLKLINTDSREKDVLNAEEAQEESLEGTVADSVDLACLLLRLLPC